MRAAVYDVFGGPIEVRDLKTPVAAHDGVVIEVRATGLCLSDWHGYMGHDPMVTLPHVPGHEFSGVVAEVGSGVQRFGVGDRVTAPFVVACGSCAPCIRGDGQVCDAQEQPGFSYFGSFAEYVAVPWADTNLVKLPDALDLQAAASLGCRFATAFRAVVDQGGAGAGTRVAVFGCGGVGLAALMIAGALGAETIAIDVADEALALARQLGAEHTIRSSDEAEIEARVRDIWPGGADLGIEAIGNRQAFRSSITCLRKRGRHVQVGLLVGSDQAPASPMDRVIGWELEIVGSHGMAARHYPRLFEHIESGRLDPSRLVRAEVSLEQGARLLPDLHRSRAGITLISISARESVSV